MAQDNEESIEKAEEAAIDTAFPGMYYNIPITSGYTVSMETPDKKLNMDDIGLIEDFLAILKKTILINQKQLPPHPEATPDAEFLDSQTGKAKTVIGDLPSDKPVATEITSIKDIGVGRIELQNFCRRHYELLKDAIDGNHEKPWLSEPFKKFCIKIKDEGLYAKQVIYKDIMDTCGRIYNKLKEIEA